MKLVLVVRTDLKMGKGKAAAQCGHATLAAYKSVASKSPAILRAWEYGGQAKVVVKAQSEAELDAMYSTCRSMGVAANAIRVRYSLP